MLGEDDASLSDVFMTEVPPPYKKHVRFYPSVQVHHIPTCAHTPDLWWTRQELEVIRTRARALSSEIVNKTSQENSGTNGSDHYLSYHNVMERVYEKSLRRRMDLSQDDLKGLQIWVTYGHSRRGLERHNNPSVGLHKQDQRNALVESLFYVQNFYPDYDEETLRQISEHYSEPSKLWALAMAKADAVAAASENAQMPAADHQKGVIV
jgi:hypothetical protein